jgi:DNA-binding MarR family transcriptional regulator
MGSCRIPKPQDPGAAARAEVVELLFTYVDRLRTHFEGVAAEHGLTSAQAKVLMFLDHPEPMRSIAECLACDPSNITGLVDRLEERGLLSRSEGETDRRIRFLQVTPSGKKLRDSFTHALFSDVPGMTGLSRAQVMEVRHALATLCRDEAPVK